MRKSTRTTLSAWGASNYYKSLEFEADGGSKSWRPDLQPQGLSFTYFLWFGHGLASSPVQNIKHLSASFPLRTASLPHCFGRCPGLSIPNHLSIK